MLCFMSLLLASTAIANCKPTHNLYLILKRAWDTQKGNRTRNVLSTQSLAAEDNYVALHGGTAC